jgi:predicted Zn-dependent peptidase
MFWEITDPGLAETATLGHYEYLGAGMFYTWLACEPELVQENLNRLRGIYRQVELDGITQQELSQAKNKVKARVVLGSERPQSRLFNLGGNWLQRREYRTVADDLKSLDDVTVESIRDVLKQYPFSNASTITVGPRTDVKAPE